MKYTRPHDYYAEMIKTDGHMEKVKSKLLGEKERLDEREEKRKQRENPGFAQTVRGLPPRRQYAGFRAFASFRDASRPRGLPSAAWS